MSNDSRYRFNREMAGRIRHLIQAVEREHGARRVDDPTAIRARGVVTDAAIMEVTDALFDAIHPTEDQ